MFTTSSLSRVCDVSPKVIAAGGDPEVLVNEALYDLFLVRTGEDGGLVVEGAEGERALEAPPTGPVVIAAADTDTVAALSAFWSRAGLPFPETVMLSGDAAGDRVQIAAALARAALPALREELEYTRARWQDCSAALRTVTRDLPLLAFSTQDSEGTRALGPGVVLSQMLPFAGPYCKAVSVQIAQPATAPGQLECRLTGEDGDVTLAVWSDVDATARGWRMFDMPNGIPWSHRDLRLVLTWSGPAEGAPHLTLAATPETDCHAVHENAVPQSGLRLAMRVWIGHPTAPVTAFEAQSRGDRSILGGGAKAVALDRAALEAHRKLVRRSLGEWPWVNIEDTGIMVHPTLKGPSIVGLDIDLAYPVTGFAMTLESPNAAAPEIEFLVAVFRNDIDLTLDGRLPDPLPHELAVAETAWLPVMPGSAMPMVLRLPAGRIGALQLVLATRVTGSTISHAHGWFRDIRAQIKA